MKNLFIAVLCIGMFASCSNDDSSSDTASDNTFLPLGTGNYWTYDAIGTTATGRDSLYIANDTVIGGETYKKFRTLSLPMGFFAGSMNNNAARKVNSSIVVSGSSQINFGQEFPLEINLNNFVIFRENAAANEQLSSVSGEITQEFDGYPLTFSYVLKSVAGESLTQYTSNGVTYDDVKSVKVIMNMSVQTTVAFGGIDFDVNIMQAQDVIVSNQYYAKNIGMVHANTVISYELEDLGTTGVVLPIPPSATETQNEYLDTYQVD